MIHFFVPGDPVGKGRARVTKTGHAYTPDKTRKYEELVKWCCLQTHCPPYPKGIQLHLYIEARYPIPKNTSKRVRELMLRGEILPTVKPDLSNVLKAIEDGMNGIAYHDDSHIVCIGAKKIFSAVPGVDVIVSELDE